MSYIFKTYSLTSTTTGAKIPLATVLSSDTGIRNVTMMVNTGSMGHPHADIYGMQAIDSSTGATFELSLTDIGVSGLGAIILVAPAGIFPNIIPWYRDYGGGNFDISITGESI